MTTKKNKKDLENELVQLLGPRFLELLSNFERVELDQFEMEIGDLELWLHPGALIPSLSKSLVEPVGTKPTAILQEEFISPVETYPGSVKEVTLGATKKEGGSRGKPVIIGGSTSPAFTLFEGPPKYPPVIALDVFDMKFPLPKVLRENVQEVMDDPAEWAKMNVNKFGAEVVTVHLMSTDPLIADTPPAKAAKTVEEVLQSVDVPLIIGGCGDPKKDADVFVKITEVAEGERVLLNSVTLDMAEARTLETVARAAKDHNQLVLAFTGLDLNSAKELNRRLYAFLPPENIVMDLTTAALGYGLEYSFTIHERARLAALMGDSELQHPTVSGSTNAWAAREAWMQMDPKYGPKEFRGPVWEAVTALSLLLAGVDLFMMMHPAAVHAMKEAIQEMLTPGKAQSDRITDWINMRL